MIELHSVTIALYLYTCGIEPLKEIKQKDGSYIFIFEDTEEVNDILINFITEVIK